MIVVIDGNRRLDDVELDPDHRPAKDATVGEWVDELVDVFPVTGDAAGVDALLSFSLAGEVLDRDRKVASLPADALLEVVAL